MKFRVKSTLKYSVQRMTPTKAVRIALLVISDALILNIASFLALWVRFEFHFEQLVRETEYLNNILRFAPYYTASDSLFLHCSSFTQAFGSLLQ